MAETWFAFYLKIVGSLEKLLEVRFEIYAVDLPSWYVLSTEIMSTESFTQVLTKTPTGQSVEFKKTTVVRSTFDD